MANTRNRCCAIYTTRPREFINRLEDNGKSALLLSSTLDDLKKLIKRLEYLTQIPKPDLQLLPDTEKDEKQIEQNIYQDILKGNTHSLV